MGRRAYDCRLSLRESTFFRGAKDDNRRPAKSKVSAIGLTPPDLSKRAYTQEPGG